MTTRLFAVIAALLFLSACAGAGGNSVAVKNGSGAVTMTPAAFAAFNAYRSKADPLVFALSPDGSQYYWYYCVELQKDCDVEAYMQDAVSRCSLRGNGQTCRVFARRKAIVWRDAGSFAPPNTSG